VVPGLPIASPDQPRVIQVSSGQASWYGPGFYGNRTASGEVLRPGTLTAAHRTLPFGTLVRVTNLGNGRTAVVRINDRGPFHGTRVIDLAHGAASELGVASSGIAKVRLEVLR
jgi:rare lipoprotein A